MEETKVESRLWQLYVQWCKDHGLVAKVKDYMIWLDDHDYDLEAEE